MFLHIRLHRVLLLVFLLLLLSQGTWASTVGKISGSVTNQGNNQPIAGANVVVLGTTMGSTAGADGRFSILNVPAGTYRLQASIVGYKPFVMENIQVRPDFTTEVNFALEQTVLGIIQTVEVRAEKPLIQKDLTGTARFLDRSQIENLPTRGYQEAAALQAGVVSQQINQDVSTADLESSNAPRLHVRGGRAEEVAYYVDGFSQQDPLTGLSTTSINQNAIDQIVVLTGGFNAEYGKIMSGAVNVITREGGKKYFGSAEAITDNLGGSWIGTKKYDNNTYDLSLGGPLIPGSDQVTFFVSGERRWEGDRAPHPINGIGLTSDQVKLYKDGRLPNNALSGYTYQGKLAWNVSRQFKLHAGTLSSRDDWQEYHHQYLFDQAHMPRYQDTNKSYFGTATYAPTPKTFVTLGLNYFYTERFRGDGVHFKDLAAYGLPDGNPRYNANAALFWYGDTTNGFHVWDDYLHRESSYVGGKADVSFQWSPSNQGKIGAEYRRHTLRRYRHLFPVQVYKGVDGGGYQDVDRFGYALTDPTQHLDSGLDGAKHPKDASIYIQDKYEKDQLVVNAGLRYDYLNAETDVLANEGTPLEFGGNTLAPQDLKTGKAKNKLSPRLGIGFPVTDKMQFHSNYGIFYQQPNLEDLYVGYNYLGYKVFTGGYYYPFGNPALQPETTTAYEIGLAQQVSDNSRFDVTAFYKNVRDLVEVQSVRAAPNSYTTFRNTDYGTIKGVDMTFDLRRTNNISSSVNYTFSYANGTGSVSNTQRNIAWTGGQPPKQTSPLDFDQRHKISINVDWRLGKGGGPLFAGMHPLEYFGVNLLANMASGSPFTPTKPYDEVTLAAVNVEPAGPINSRYGPWTYRIDAKVDRTFDLGNLNLNAYVWILNLFNRKNPVNVYTSSGVSDETGWLSTVSGATAYSTAQARELYNLAEKNPNNYDIPRMIRFGLRTSF